MDDTGNIIGGTASRSCVACGTLNAGAARFCANCGAILPSVATDPNDGAAALMADARRNLDDGAWEEAALAAEAVLALSPDSAEAHNLLARARLRQGMRTVAAVHAQKAVDLEPGVPEYRADLAMATAGDDNAARTRAMWLAGTAGLVVILLVLAIAWASRAGGRLNDERPIADSGSGAPSQALNPSYPNAPMPQPTATPGAVTNRPRVPGPTQLADEEPTAAPALPQRSNTPTTRVNAIPPATVDTSPLTRFRPLPPEPAPQPAPVTQTPPPVATGTAPWSTPPEVSKPTTVPPDTLTFTPKPEPQPVQPSPPATRPQQAFIDRDYGQAINGYLRIINSGRADGQTYQQLAASYEAVGKRAEAANAYREAIRLFEAQVASNQNVANARRGIRVCQRALISLENR